MIDDSLTDKVFKEVQEAFGLFLDRFDGSVSRAYGSLKQQVTGGEFGEGEAEVTLKSFNVRPMASLNRDINEYMVANGFEASNGWNLIYTESKDLSSPPLLGRNYLVYRSEDTVYHSFNAIFDEIGGRDQW